MVPESCLVRPQVLLRRVGPIGLPAHNLPEGAIGSTPCDFGSVRPAALAWTGSPVSGRRRPSRGSFASIPERSPPAVLLRESYREDGKVKKRTLLKRSVALPSLGHTCRILRSRSHGHMAAVLGCARNSGLEKLLDRRISRERALAAAIVLARIRKPRSKLATSRSLRSETLTHTLGEKLGIEDAGGDELCRAMDWLLKRQDRIERHLAARDLGDGALVLCDITAVYFEGSKCPLARLGYSRDGQKVAGASSSAGITVR